MGFMKIMVKRPMVVCEKYLECSLRREYVSKVFLSMNKGKSGGFEF